MADGCVCKWIVVAAVSAGLTGCGGGATETPTVKLKPAADASKGNGNETPSPGNGETPAGPGGGVGTITGKVVVKGQLPSLPAIVKKGANIKDAEVCAAADIPDESLLGTGGGVANVLLYLTKAPPGGKSSSSEELAELTFDNKQCRFVPHVLFSQTGQTVMVTNSDSIPHNTHTFPTRNDGFNSLIRANDTTGIPLKYERAEAQPVQVKCDFHAWMIAYHLVLDHPYGAVTAEDGSFQIKDLPVGKHSFRIWHERGGQLDRGYEVTVKQGDNEPITIEFDAAKFARYDGPAPQQVMISLK